MSIGNIGGIKTDLTNRIGTGLIGKITTGFSAINQIKGIMEGSWLTPDPQWMIHDDESGIDLIFSALFSIDYTQETKVIHAPTETAFVAYNKVLAPKELSMQACIRQKDTNDMGKFTRVLGLLADSTRIVSVITPERTYPSLNITSFNFSRNHDDGVDQIIFDFKFIEVKEVKSEYSNVQVAKTQKTGKKNGVQSALSGAKAWLKGF